MMKQASELNRITNKGLKPLPEMSVSEWADNYRMLSSGISAEPGRYKTSRAPYQREVMDSFTQPGIWKAVAKFCSQSGKSDVASLKMIQRLMPSIPNNQGLPEICSSGSP